MTLPQQLDKRLAYIDWMRGLACALMFQAHCYTSWLSPQARKSALFAGSQLWGTLPGPLFIFLSGVSIALVTEKLREKGTAIGAIARKTIFRGFEIYALGLLFRVQEFVLGYPMSPWTDLFIVDILNLLGVSIMLMGVMSWLTARRKTTDTLAKYRQRTIIGSLTVAAVVALSTPPLWTTSRLTGIPWPLESYLNGVHTFGRPQVWLFPIFPWVAFAFAGLAAGFFLVSDFARRDEILAMVVLGGTGTVACGLSVLADRGTVRLYDPVIYDYWHTSPNFFMVRSGVLLMIVFLAYAWCRWGPSARGFSPMIQLGQTSLLVYWAHMEFVYGRLSILPKGRCSNLTATLGFLIILVAMLAVSIWRTRWKQRAAKVSETHPAGIAATAESG